jgi:hypothetical protein
MESHDEERIMYKCISEGNVGASHNIRDTTVALKRSEMCAAFLMSIPGPKMVWQFGELGYDYPINYCPDGTVNSGCRTAKKPVRWNYQQESRRQHLYDIYSTLNKLRTHPWYKDVFIANNINITRNFTGSFKTMTVRSAADSSMLCVLGNFDINSQANTFTFPAAGTWYDYINGTTFTATGTGQTITLQPGEYRLFVNRNVSNIVSTPVIDITNPGNDLQVAVYPNPVRQSTLELFVPVKENIEASLWNARGQKIAIIFTGILNRGMHTFSLSSKTDNLPAGMYLLKVDSKGASRSLKLLVK